MFREDWRKGTSSGRQVLCLVALCCVGLPPSARGRADQVPKADPPAVEVLSRTAVQLNPAIGIAASVEVTAQIDRVTLRSGNRDQFAHVFIVRQPTSGLYWWTYQLANSGSDPLRFADRWFVYFSDDKAVGFSCCLWVREVAGRGSDVAAVERSILAELAERAGALIQGHHMGFLGPVDFSAVGRRLGDDFWHLRNTVVGPTPVVVGVRYDHNLWILRLEGPNHDFAELILDGQYTPRDAHRLPDGR